LFPRRAPGLRRDRVERKFWRRRCIFERGQVRFEQAFNGPLGHAQPGHQQGLHRRRLAADHEHPPAGVDPAQELLGHLGHRTGHDDHVVGLFRLPAAHHVADEQFDVGDALVGQLGGRFAV
jgi:hypothetical protein